MNSSLLIRIRRIAAFSITLPILIGCAPYAVSTPPTTAPIQANLTAIETPVRISGTTNSESTLQKDQTISIKASDRIIVPESGHAVLRFKDRVVVDILRGSELGLSDAKPEPGDAIFVIVKQIRGHTRVSLSENANARLRLETDHASITTLKAGTEYMVCHDPALITCIVVLKGEVEVAGQARYVTVKAGESTYVLKGKPPLPPLCAHLDEVNAWLDKKLGSGTVRALGEIVSGWKQEPCTTTTAQSPTVVSTVQPLPQLNDMVKIEAGAYTVGSSTQDDFHIPLQQKELATFWIDIYEVTNAQYQKFIDETGHAPPQVWPGKEKHPVKGVSWDDVVAYCTWQHKRLPAEAEWEVAARGPGPDAPLFPWGNDPNANGEIDLLPRTETYEVGSVAFNKSPFGVYDMAGNVWEWVNDPYDPIPEGFRILRGGRHGLVKDMAFRQQAEPNNERFVPFAGFRCAADQVQGQ